MPAVSKHMSRERSVVGRRRRASGLAAAVLIGLTVTCGMHVPGTSPALAAITNPWGTLVDAWRQHQEELPTLTVQFLSLAAQGVGMALIIGLPLGVGLTRLPRLASPSLSVLAVIQTVPSLALLGLLIPLMGIGRPPALVATVVYSLLPVVMNTYVGIVQVPAAVRDAARGMGMTSAQILCKVELPLALPVILAGVRTGVVYAIGVITVCALAGAGGLGEFITRGLSRSDNGLLLLGTVPILLITLVVFWSVGGIAYLAKRNATLGLAVAASLTVCLAGYAAVESLRGLKGHDRLVIGSKNFTENIVLAEMMRLLLTAHTDLQIETRLGLGSDLVYRATVRGDIHLYPEYTGTLLTAKGALDLPVPEDKSTLTDLVRRQMDEKFDLALLETFGLNNTYAMSVRREVAEQYGLKTIGDLARTPQLRVVFADEFHDRPDGWPGLAKLYGIDFDERPPAMSPELMYTAMSSGQADLCSGFATDWQIELYELVVLEDPRQYFSSYHAAPLIRKDVLARYPQVQEVLNKLAGQIDDETIRGLNRAVVVEKRREADVARQFLIDRGLIPDPAPGADARP